MRKEKVVEAKIIEDNNEYEKTYFFPRVIAYILDIIIIAVISSAIVMMLPTDKNYDKYVEEYKNIQGEYLEQKITMDEYVDKSKDVVYKIDKLAIPSTLIQTVLYIGYFIVFQVYNKGQTLGKKLMRIKLISTRGNELEDKKLTVNQVAIRSIIINSIGINILMLGSILFIGKEYYFYASTAIQALSSLIVIVTLVMVCIRKDGKGLHDVAAGTQVVNCK